MDSPQFGFGTSALGGWPASSTSAPSLATPTTNFGNLAASNNKPATTITFPSFGNLNTPATSSISFGTTTTLASTTTKPGILNELNFYLSF